MDPSPAWSQFQVIPTETLLIIPIFLHPHPLSFWGFFHAHVSAGTNPFLSLPFLREGPGNTYVPPKSLTRGFVVSEEEFDEENTTHNAQRLSQVCCNRVL